MFGLGFQELLIVLVIALIVFGPARLPQIGSGLGKAIRDFKKGVNEENAGEPDADKDERDKKESDQAP